MSSHESAGPGLVVSQQGPGIFLQGLDTYNRDGLRLPSMLHTCPTLPRHRSIPCCPFTFLVLIYLPCASLGLAHAVLCACLLPRLAIVPALPRYGQSLIKQKLAR